MKNPINSSNATIKYFIVYGFAKAATPLRKVCKGRTHVSAKSCNTVCSPKIVTKRAVKKVRAAFEALALISTMAVNATATPFRSSLLANRLLSKRT
eukprot:1189311-Prymnesium_polylepis.1